MNGERHKHYLQRCIALARRTMEAGNPPFASLLVIGDQIVLEAVNTTKEDNNFLHHGEMNLLWHATQKLPASDLQRATLYAGGEPCPMCAGAIYWSGIRSLVYGCGRDALAGIRKFGLNVPCRDILERGSDTFHVTGPLMENEVKALYSDFYGTSEP